MYVQMGHSVASQAGWSRCDRELRSWFAGRAVRLSRPRWATRRAGAAQRGPHWKVAVLVPSGFVEMFDIVDLEPDLWQ